MSRKIADIDERARRTRDALARALMQLSREKPIDAITVGELTRAAGIGRSTFYTHFAGLPDFLRSSYAAMLERSARLAQERGSEAGILSVGLILDHMARSGNYGALLRQSREWPSIHAAGRDRLSRIAEMNLAKLRPELDPQTRCYAADYLTGGFMGMLDQWTSSGRRHPPEQLRLLFEELTDAAVSCFDRIEAVSPPCQQTKAAARASR